MLYSRQMTGTGFPAQMKAHVMDMSVTSANDNVELGRFEGIVECTDVDNIGYGFALGESHFETSVPYDAEQVKINLFANNNSLITNE